MFGHCRRPLGGEFSVAQFGGPVRFAFTPAHETRLGPIPPDSKYQSGETIEQQHVNTETLIQGWQESRRAQRTAQGQS